MSLDGFLIMSNHAFLLISHVSCNSLVIPFTCFGHFVPVTFCMLLLVLSLNMVYLSSMLTSLSSIRSNGLKAPLILISDCWHTFLLWTILSVSYLYAVPAILILFLVLKSTKMLPSSMSDLKLWIQSYKLYQFCRKHFHFPFTII